MVKNHIIDDAALIRDLQSLFVAIAAPATVETTQATFQLGTLAMLDAVLRDGESRNDLLREVVRREIRRRADRRSKSTPA